MIDPAMPASDKLSFAIKIHRQNVKEEQLKKEAAAKAAETHRV